MRARKTGFVMIAVVALCLLAKAATLELSIGKDGFVFEGLHNLFGYDHYADMPERRAHQIEVLRAINQELRKRGTQLSIALVPMAERLLEDKLPDGLKLPEAFRNSYQDLSARLERAGVLVPDINSALQKHPARLDPKFPIWMRQDNHWSPVGALEAARVMAQALRSQRSETLKTLPEIRQTLRFAAPRPFEGNYWNALSATQRASMTQDLIRQPLFTSQGTDLLGGDPPGIVVVGTSFSSFKAFGFVDGLASQLSREISNHAQPGKGFWTPMAEYLASDEYQRTPPKLLVWEIPERFLMVGQPPLDFADDWAHNQLLLELAANLGGNCATGLKPLAVEATGFTRQDNTWYAATNDADAVIKLQFPRPVGFDQYLSLELNSSNSDSFLLEINQNHYYARLGRYGQTQRVNVPLATIADGSQTISVKGAPASDLRVLDAKVCNMPNTMMRLLKN